MSDLNELDGTTQPQSCYKCNTLPEDILMLACGHDLCLNCAAERLSIESRRKSATGIVCEFCGEKTQLDADSIFELQKITQSLEMKPKRDIRQSNLRAQRPSDDEDIRRTQKYSKFEKAARNEKRDYLGPGMDSKSVVVPETSGYAQSYSVTNLMRKNCSQHPEEELLYFCFDCNCECICPECVIHGKHKEHQVKTIKKSCPIVKSKLQYFHQNIDTNIDVLISKRNQFESHIKELVDQNNLNKKQIQRSFAQVRTKLNIKEKQTLAKCNRALESSLDIYDRGIKGILKKIQDIKLSSHTIVDNLKKDEIVMLNFYAKKHQDFQQLMEKVDVSSFINSTSDQLLNHQQVTKTIAQISEQIQRVDIDSSTRYDSKYDQKDNRVNIIQEDSEYSRAKKYTKEQEKPSREYLRRF